MNSSEIRKNFLEFFEKRGHKIVPSSSLLPDDPSVLLTTAGMQQFKKYYTEPALAPAEKMVSIQKCFRTSDIDEVGDESHLTFFEMLGNFSFGGYFKDKAIEYGFEFIKSLGIEIDYVTVFDPDKVPEGDWRKRVPFDKESYEIWQKYLPEEKIRREGTDNFWGPTGGEGPCGPTTEIYVSGVEIWNIVFNQFYCSKDTNLSDLKIQGIDTGMGLERLAMISQNKKNIFETDLFLSLINSVPSDLHLARKRIIADHIRGVAFLIADGIQPSNKGAGYVLRRLMRRMLTYEYLYKIPPHTFSAMLRDVVNSYGDFYKELGKVSEMMREVLEKERNSFLKVLPVGLKRLDFLVEKWKKEGRGTLQIIPEGGEIPVINRISGKDVFDLYQTYGLPEEVIEEELAVRYGYTYNKEEFKQVFLEATQKHKEISRAGIEKKFGGHGLLLDTGELKAADEEELKKVTRLHTATHLLQAALRKVLGDEVKQAGSDITAERARFDFTFERKLMDEEIKKVEDLVNEAVDKKLPVNFKEMPYEEAVKTGALHFFSARGGSAFGGKEKYPEKVKVYYAGESIENAFSKEFCGGPHVENTSEVGHFRIVKQEAIGSGLRRLRATVE